MAQYTLDKKALFLLIIFLSSVTPTAAAAFTPATNMVTSVLHVYST